MWGAVKMKLNSTYIVESLLHVKQNFKHLEYVGEKNKAAFMELRWDDGIFKNIL